MTEGDHVVHAHLENVTLDVRKFQLSRKERQEGA